MHASFSLFPTLCQKKPFKNIYIYKRDPQAPVEQRSTSIPLRWLASSDRDNKRIGSRCMTSILRALLSVSTELHR